MFEFDITRDFGKDRYHETLKEVEIHHKLKKINRADQKQQSSLRKVSRQLRTLGVQLRPVREV